MVDVLDDNYLALSGLMAIGMQLLFFFIAWNCKFDKVTDIAGTMNFVINAWVTFLLRETYYTRQLVATILVTAWGFRLGGFLLYRVLQRGKDERFDQMRDKFFSFLGFWIFQMVWVFVVSLPVTFLNAAKVDKELGGLDYAGWALWGIGWIFEAVADQTKHWYMNDKSPNKSKFLNSSVWSITRHPNYFGEIIVWIGMFLTACSVFEVNDKGGYASVLSPAITYLLLVFVSGIPGAEERYDQKYGKLPEYLEYKKKTSPLIPLPTCCYVSLPQSLKCLFCCEYAMFSKGLNNPAPSKDHQKLGPEHQVGPTGASMEAPKAADASANV